MEACTTGDGGYAKDGRRAQARHAGMMVRESGGMPAGVVVQVVNGVQQRLAWDCLGGGGRASGGVDPQLWWHH